VSGEGSKPAAGDGGRLERQELFISYSHKDRAYLERLWIHLHPLETQYGLQRWDDSRLQPGDLWLEEIEKALQRAQVALLLVSPDFLASAFIQRKELPPLFEAAKKDGLKILWVPLLPSSWKRYRQIEQYQAVIPVERTLAEMDAVERDRALVAITDQIHDLFERIQEQRLASQQAAEAEASAQRQEAEQKLLELERKRQAEEKERLERLKAESEAGAEVERLRLEAERLRGEAERSRAEVERLAQEKQEWQRKATSISEPLPSRSDLSRRQGPSLISIGTKQAWLLQQDGNPWQKREEVITVTGYREELADGIAITMLRIPEGEFLMGSPEQEAERMGSEGPQHQVKLRSFFLGQTPVTQAQWRVVAGWPKLEMELSPAPTGFQGDNRPVERVSWPEAMEFCRRLSQRSQREYTLPSEAQWEYACRAGTTTPFAFGNTLTHELANYAAIFTYGSGPVGVFRLQTTEVGSFPANGWGLQDMHGNVWEWCLDDWHNFYHGAPTDGGAWISGEAATKLLRGGSWDAHPRGCRSAYRLRFPPDCRGHAFGFRLCCLPQDLFLYT
jgi:formylglycine-generating enzyme required for sulfatase activity